MRIAYEFKVSPAEVLEWDTALFDYTCAYINLRDETEKKRADEMNAQARSKHAPTMRGGRR